MTRALATTLLFTVAVAANACGGGATGRTADTAPPTDTALPSEGPVYVQGCEATEPDAPTAAYHLKPAFEAAWPLLDNPVELVFPPDGSDRAFVVNQGGTIVQVEGRGPAASASIWFGDDRAAPDVNAGGELGLLSLVFAPDFADSGEFYVHYNSRRDPPGQQDLGLHSRVSRFVVRDADGGADPRGDVDYAGEEILLTLRQPAGNHNGGQLGFHPDEPDHLYVAFGDGGNANDSFCNGQNLGTLLGTILRLDVSGDGASYAIPADNPFVGTAGARGEIYAYGLRNPWRFSFDKDPVTDAVTLWVADVGQHRQEEVDHVTAGGNYGWSLREGFAAFSTPCDDYDTSVPVIDPIDAYGRDLGGSISGGYVYRGPRAALAGAYLFADFSSGRIWALRASAGGWQREQLFDTDFNIPGFGRDAAGRVYAIDYGGRIFEVDHDPQFGVIEGFRWKDRLSDTGCYADLGGRRLATNALHYGVNAALWSDGTDKDRAIVLPEGGQIGYDAVGAWSLPVGTQVIKAFALEGRPLETRFLVHREDGWHGATYIWNDAGDDATISVDRRTVTVGDDQAYMFPGAGDCAQCHSNAASFLLGVRTHQLNRVHPVLRSDDPRNTIDLLRERSFFTPDEDVPISEELPAFPDLTGDPDAADRGPWARAYLDANCAHCHRPGGGTGMPFDLRHATALTDTRLCDARPTNDLGLGAAARLIAPGDPDSSVLVHRVEREDALKMPPLARNVVDTRAAGILRAWIGDLTAADCVE